MIMKQSRCTLFGGWLGSEIQKLCKKSDGFKKCICLESEHPQDGGARKRGAFG